MVIKENNPNLNSSDLKPHTGIWLLIRNDNDEIFMFFHKKFNTWTIPLEKTDPQESIEDAIIRTGKEELDIEIEEYEIILKYEHTFYRNGVLLDIPAYLVAVKKYHNKPKNVEVDKHSDSGWKKVDFVLQIDSELVAVKELQKYLKKTNT